MRAALLRLWHALSARHGRPLPPPYVIVAYRERTARIQQRWLPYCGLGLVLVFATPGGLDRWANPSSDASFVAQLAIQVAIVLLAVVVTRGPALPPQRIERVAVGMLLAMLCSEAIFCALLPGPTDTFTLLVVCYLLSARLMFAGSVVPQLLISVACILAQTSVLVVARFPAPVVVANALVFVFISALLLVGVAVTYEDDLERLYRRQMNRVVFAMASRPAAEARDVRSSIRQMTELACRTLDATRVEVWLPNEELTVMRWIDGYESIAGRRAARAPISLRDHPEYASGLDRDPLVQSYQLPASAVVCPHLEGAQVASVLEAAVRVRGRTGVL